jgi:hypothetical protein
LCHTALTNHKLLKDLNQQKITVQNNHPQLEAPTFSRGAANQSSTHQKIQRRGQDTPTVPTTRAVAYSFDTDERRPHHHSGGGGFQSAGYHFIPKGNGAQLPPLEKRLKRFQSFPVLDSE